MADETEDEAPAKFSEPLDSMAGTTSLDVPTLFVEGIHGVMFSKDVVKIAFYEERQDVIQGDLKRHHIVRLAIPISAFGTILEHLKNVSEGLGDGDA